MNATAHSTKPVETKVSLESLFESIQSLHAKIDDMKAAGPQRGSRQSQREMTDDDARQVLSELATMKHNEAADKLGLSYGQVYSARLGYTFKHIRKELTEAKVKNQWLDTTHNG